MGYLDNSSITVDAILTKRGRELLSRNDGSFRITQFALGDDEIDYTLFNENHPNGTQYASEAIENMPLIEAIPDGSNMMKSHLITLARGKSLLPYIQTNQTNNTVTLFKGGNGVTIAPQTFNINSNSTSQSGIETGGYRYIIVNFNFLKEMTSTDPNFINSPANLEIYGGTEATMEQAVGDNVTLIPTNEDALFPSGTDSITTTLIIEGMETGARKTLQVVITKQ